MEAPLADASEVLALVERQRRFGKGIGCVDVHLLASVVLSGSLPWTRDRRLRAAPQSLGVEYQRATHRLGTQILHGRVPRQLTQPLVLLVPT